MMDKYPIVTINKKINECGQQLEKEWGGKLSVFHRKPSRDWDINWWVQGKELGIDEDILAKFCVLVRVEEATFIALDKLFEGHKSFLELAKNYENLFGLVVKKFSFPEDKLWDSYEANYDLGMKHAKLEILLKNLLFSDNFNFSPDELFEFKSAIAKVNGESFSIIFDKKFPKKTISKINNLMIVYDKAQCIFDDYSDVLDDISKKDGNSILFFIRKYGADELIDWIKPLWGKTDLGVEFEEFENNFLKDSSYTKVKDFYSNLQKEARKYKFPRNTYLFKKEGWDLPFDNRIKAHMKTAVI